VYGAIRVVLQSTEHEELFGSGRGPLAQAVGEAGESQVLARREVVVDAEGVGHPPQRGPHRARLGHRIETGDPHRALVGQQESGKNEQQRGLAGTVGADEPRDLAVPGRKIDSSKREHRAKLSLNAKCDDPVG
jgi:hypothetical protein